MLEEVRQEFQALDRDELLFLCEALAGRCFSAKEQDRLILRACWEAACVRAERADSEFSEAHTHWVELAMRPGKLTSVRLAEQEKAERRQKKLKKIAEIRRDAERRLWAQISAEWNVGGEAA